MKDLSTRTGIEAEAALPMPSVGALFGLRLAELQAVLAGLGQKPYRARQVFDALYRQRVTTLHEMMTLPVELRAALQAAGWSVGLPEMVQTAVSVDGTERYLMRMADGETVETVWMPDGDGGERGDGSEAAAEEAGEVVAAEDAVQGQSETQIPYGNDNQKSNGETQIPFGNDNQKSKSETQIPFGNDNQERQRQTRIPFGNDSQNGNGESGVAESRVRPDSYRAGGRLAALKDGQRKLDRRNHGALAQRGYRRATICISSQVGCAVNCQFCLTAKLGIRRNLTAGEIAGQVAAVLNRHSIEVGKDRINLVFMGMGEPFLNYAQFMESVRVLVEGIGIPESRMTVSTSGILPGIEAFAAETVRPKLALSLNASNDQVRERVMPITRKWNIAALLQAVARIPLRTREWVTFEYVLLGGVNDQPEHAREVLALLAGMRAKVNLIVWNPGPGIDYVQPGPEAVAVFQKMLIEGGIATYIRRPRGRDIYAACGQLKRTVAEQPQELVVIGAAAI